MKTGSGDRSTCCDTQLMIVLKSLNGVSLESNFYKFSAQRIRHGFINSKHHENLKFVPVVYFPFEYFPKVDVVLPNKSMMAFDHSPSSRSFYIWLELQKIHWCGNLVFLSLFSAPRSLCK